MSLKRSLQLVLLLTALLLPVVVQAQAPTPAPSPVRSLSDNMSALSQRAAGLLPYFDNEIVSKLIGWFELLAWVLGNCLAGFAMLLVPGQGLLTMAVGLMLSDFPGKYRLEQWLVSRASVWRSINWIRKRARREPLKRPV